MNMRVNRTKDGFTLIELLLYVSITSIMLLVVFVFLAGLLQSRVKNQVISQVDHQGTQAMQLITQAIRNAEAIQMPLQGQSASSLSLDVLNGADDPTVFTVSNGVLEISEGNNSSSLLLNSRVQATELFFQNLEPGIIRIRLTLSHVNPVDRNEYEYSQTFYGSAALRNF